MAGMGDVFGQGSTARQLLEWSVLNQIIGAIAAPALTAITREVNERAAIQDIPLQAAAEAVVRNIIDVDTGLLIAHRMGFNDEQFRRLVALAGDAPAPQELAVALRRGLVEEAGVGAESTSFTQGIAEGRLADKWAPLIKELSVADPSPIDALDALLQGQIDEPTGKTLYARFGGNTEYFDMMFNTRGTAPTPSEALELANRGIIPWEGTGPDSVSYEQAFLEGPWRNKWLAPFRALGAYLPPPRTVTAMHTSGSLTDAQALDLLIKQGLTPDLAAAYISDSKSTKTGADRDLAKSDIIGLYAAGVINTEAATSFLEALKYSADEAAYILELADLRRAIAAVNLAVSRIHTLYVGHKIPRTVAVDSLALLKVPAGQVDQIIGTWDLEASVNVKLPTESQIVDAWFEQIIDQPTAERKLQEMGYSAHDAWLLLSLKQKEPLPDEPADLPPTPAGAPGERG